MSTISPPRLTRQFQLASDPGLHHPPVLCRRGPTYFPCSTPFCSLSTKSILFYGICQAVIWHGTGFLKSRFFTAYSRLRRSLLERDGGVCVALPAPHKHHHLSQKRLACEPL